MYDNITDKGIEYIKDLPLQVVYLTGTKITDKSIPIFEQMKTLEELVIDKTLISLKGAKTLESKIKATVRYSDDDFSRE